MTDHVTRLVNGWRQTTQREGSEQKAVSQLVDAIHRLLRETESATRKRCEEIAVRAAGPSEGAKVALAIRALSQRGERSENTANTLV
jgi:hypothetical protein